MTGVFVQRGFGTAMALCLALGYVSVAHAQVDGAQTEPVVKPPRAHTGRLVPVEEFEDLANVEISPALIVLVDALDAPDFEQRERAFERMMESEPELIQFRALLHNRELSLEQRHRVLMAARISLVDRPRGALGIQMEARPKRVGDEKRFEIEIMRLLPDLPARHVLRIGDRITQINGDPILERQDLLRAAQERQPGDTLTLSLRRVQRDDLGNAIQDADGALQYQQMTVDLVLGSAKKLITNQGLVDMRGPVVEAREDTADRMTREFGSPKQHLALDPDAPQPPAGPVAQNIDGPGFRLVEQHRYVQAILREKRQIADGRVKKTVMLGFWQNRVMDLQRQIEDRSLSDRDRQYLRQVRQRCLELIAD